MSVSYKKMIFFSLVFVFGVASAQGAQGVSPQTLKVKSGDVEVCGDHGCKKVTPDGEVASAINDGYVRLSVITSSVGAPDILMATTEGGNYCSKIFYYDKSGVFRPVSLKPSRELCSLKKSGDKVISSYLMDAKQYQDVYSFADGGLQLNFSDECVGCGVVKRTTYEYGKAKNHFLVSDAINYNERQSIRSKIISDKAFFYNEHDFNFRTKMYVVKGDVVDLVDYSEDGAWYFVRFPKKNGGFIEKWVECKNLEVCKH